MHKAVQRVALVNCVQCSLASLSSQLGKSPLEVRQAIEILYETIGHPQPSTLEPEAEQPDRLKILATFGALTGDPDLALLRHMERGVPTGIPPWEGLGEKLVLREQQRKNRPPRSLM